MTMKMAKASQQDLDAAMSIAQALEAISGQWFTTMPEAIEQTQDEGESEPFDIDNHKHCRRVIEHLQQLTRSASLFRVVMGMATVLHPKNKCVDPDADTIEHHPEVRAALAAHKAQPTPEQIEQHVKAVVLAHAADAMNLANIVRNGHQVGPQEIATTTESLTAAVRAAMTWNTGATQ